MIDAPKEDIYRYILTKCNQLIPSFDPAMVFHTFSGARAKNTTADWVIRPCETVPNFVHAAGVDSPGIAGSPAIGPSIFLLVLSFFFLFSVFIPPMSTQHSHFCPFTPAPPETFHPQPSTS